MIINRLQPYIPTAFAASGILLGAATTEMALRALSDLVTIAFKENSDKNRYNLSANLGGFLFYGGCALNLVPGTRVIGAAIFTSYAIYNKYSGREEYFTAKVIRVPVEKTVKAINTIFKTLWKYQHWTWYATGFVAFAILKTYGLNFQAMQNSAFPQFK